MLATLHGKTFFDFRTALNPNILSIYCRNIMACEQLACLYSYLAFERHILLGSPIEDTSC